MTFVFLCRINICTVREQSKMSSRCRVSIMHTTGARTEPWGTAAAISLGVENLPTTKTLNFLSVRKETISLMRLVENYNSDNLCSRPECHVLSEAFSISKNTAAVDIFLLKFRAAWSASLIHWSVVLCSSRKQDCLEFCVLCFRIVHKIFCP
jgi:hypothetical protein